MLVRAGKVNYVGVSNFSGWHLMKSLRIAGQNGWPRYAAHQVYYSLVGRDYEWELMPLGLRRAKGGRAYRTRGHKNLGLLRLACVSWTPNISFISILCRSITDLFTTRPGAG
jgi:hypothetical protein